MRGDSEEGRPLVSRRDGPDGPDGPDGVAPIDRSDPVKYTLGDLTHYALRLGALGFGGPVALVGYMRRDLVERRRWIAEEDQFPRHGLGVGTDRAPRVRLGIDKA